MAYGIPGSAQTAYQPAVTNIGSQSPVLPALSSPSNADQIGPAPERMKPLLQPQISQKKARRDDDSSVLWLAIAGGIAFLAVLGGALAHRATRESTVRLRAPQEHGNDSPNSSSPGTTDNSGGADSERKPFRMNTPRRVIRMPNLPADSPPPYVLRPRPHIIPPQLPPDPKRPRPPQFREEPRPVRADLEAIFRNFEQALRRDEEENRRRFEQQMQDIEDRQQEFMRAQRQRRGNQAAEPMRRAVVQPQRFQDPQLEDFHRIIFGLRQQARPVGENVRPAHRPEPAAPFHIADIFGADGLRDVPDNILQDAVPELQEILLQRHARDPAHLGYDPLAAGLAADVHSAANTLEFNQQFLELRAAVAPNENLEDINFPRLEQDIREAIRDFCQRHPQTRADIQAEMARVDEALGYLRQHGQTRANAISYDFNGGDALYLVWKSISAKADAVERDKGIENLMTGLHGAAFHCSTRHAGEVLEALRVSYADDPTQGVNIPFDDARDIMLTISRNIVPGLEVVHNDAAAEQRQFRELLAAELEQHPRITPQQTERFIQDFALVDWDQFKEGMQD